MEILGHLFTRLMNLLQVAGETDFVSYYIQNLTVFFSTDMLLSEVPIDLPVLRL